MPLTADVKIKRVMNSPSPLTGVISFSGDALVTARPGAALLTGVTVKQSKREVPRFDDGDQRIDKRRSGFSISFFRSCMKRAASQPSTTR